MNNLMTKEQFQRRYRDFDGPISELGMTNPLVNDVLQRYSHGIIITKEEALSQMVLGLARDWERTQLRYYEMVNQTCTFPKNEL